MAHGVEADRLDEARAGVPWRRWGPYLSERQWGTVREDYSDNGDAWSYFTHDQARSRAYKWGEDGIAGFCDDHQRLCFAIALWNGVDPILKERMFGLTNAEGNHGEDVKEYYFYLDATPTSSYLKYRYRYPLDEFPYDDLVATNRARGRLDFEYELLDTGVFDDDRYVDVDVEYAKRAPRRRRTCASPSPTAAPSRRRCTCCRRCGSATRGGWASRRARCGAVGDGPDASIAAEHPDLGELELRCEGDPTLLFTENETNTERLWGTAERRRRTSRTRSTSTSSHGRADAVNPARTGTKAAAHYVLDVPAERRRRRAAPRCVAPARRRSTGDDVDAAVRAAHRRGRRVLRVDHPVADDSATRRW